MHAQLEHKLRSEKEIIEMERLIHLADQERHQLCPSAKSKLDK